MKNFLTARWENLVMANFEVDPVLLQPYLPKGTELDLYKGKVYVSLVGFLFCKTRLFGVPVPFFGRFEEVNLRFYVTRQEGAECRRGVVFINEIVPHKIIAFMANWLYKEHYTAAATRSSMQVGEKRELSYHWKINKQWNHLRVTASLNETLMEKGSMEEFIFEHYYGYTKINESLSGEYRVDHPAWQTFAVESCEIKCDYKAIYGKSFAFLSEVMPSSVLLARGSAVSVKWKRRKF